MCVSVLSLSINSFSVFLILLINLFIYFYFTVLFTLPSPPHFRDLLWSRNNLFQPFENPIANVFLKKSCSRAQTATARRENYRVLWRCTVRTLFPTLIWNEGRIADFLPCGNCCFAIGGVSKRLDVSTTLNREVEEESTPTRRSLIKLL